MTPAHYLKSVKHIPKDTGKTALTSKNNLKRLYYGFIYVFKPVVTFRSADLLVFNRFNTLTS